MRRRILVATLSLTVATLIVFGVPLAWALGRFYRSEEVSRLHQAATVAVSVVPAEGLHGPDPIEPPAVPAGVHLAYYDDHGVLVAGSGPARADAAAAWALAGRATDATVGSRLVSAQPITVNETTIGGVEASSSASALAWRSRRAWLEMFGLGALTLGGAALIALWQARRLARPVDDLIAVAGRLGDGDFTVAPTRSGVAEVDRAGQALASTAFRLQELLTRERAFTAHASHQLRTPLTALRLSLDNALLTPGVDIEQAVREAVTETDRLQETVEQLFLLARSGGGGDAGGALGRGGGDAGDVGRGGLVPAPALAKRSVPVGEVLRDLERRWHPLLAERGRRFEVRQEAIAAPRVPATLGQILDILVDNAVTHGRGRVEVVASALPGASGGISVGVYDEGDGLVGIGALPLRPASASAAAAVPASASAAPAAAAAAVPASASAAPAAAAAASAGSGSNGAHGLGLGLAQSLAEAAGGRLVLRVSDPGLHEGPTPDPSPVPGPVAAVILP